MSDINELLSALKSNLGSAQEIIETECLLEKKKEVVDKFKDRPIEATIEELASVIEMNRSMMETAKQAAQASDDPAFMDSYSNLAKSYTENLKTMSMLLSEKAKIESQEKLKDQEMTFKEKQLAQQKELKLAEIASREKIAEGKKVDQPKLQQNNTFNLFSTVDKMLEAISGNKEVLKEIMVDSGIPQAQEAEIVQIPVDTPVNS